MAGSFYVGHVPSERLTPHCAHNVCIRGWISCNCSDVANYPSVCLTCVTSKIL